MRYEERKFVTEAEPAADEAWVKLQDILRTVAATPAQPREMAARYMQLREILMRSSYQPQLPGFMLQCMSLDRYREFIHLYHPQAQARIDFVNRSFRGQFFSRPGDDFLADGDF